jgi:dipeptidase E
MRLLLISNSTNPAGHAGETREQGIEEFIGENPGVYVAGLREGTMLLREGEKLNLIGRHNLRIFRKDTIPFESGSADDLSFLLK